ncbi:MAG TPA: ABC transporter ATP-binding protein [Burkholderiaceae bacterium]
MSAAGVVEPLAEVASGGAVLDVHVRRKRFGARQVLSDVRLTLQPGEVVSLVGASGCGKSTLLRIVAGLDRDYDGRVELDRRPITGPTRDIRFVFQEPRLFPWLNVARNVSFDLDDAHVSDPRHAERVRAVLAEVGLAGLADRLPKQLSGGQAQRVAIARGLFSRPRLLLLDEPFSAVDAFTQLKLQELLLDVAQRHAVTVLMVTHDIDEAVRVSERVVVLDALGGRVAAEIPIALGRPRDHDAAGFALSCGELRRALQSAHAF